MALTGTIAVNPATVTARQTATWLLTLTNTGGAEARLESVRPVVTGAGSTDESVAVLVSSAVGPFTVPAGGSLTVSGSVTPQAPARPGSAAVQYDVGAVARFSNGTDVIPTKATLTVNAPPERW